jgi:hypothetical protein
LGRIILPRRTGRVGHAVALVVVHSTGLACHAGNADDASRLQGRAVVEEIRVTVGFLFALEVTVLDWQLQALAAVDGLRAWLGVRVGLRGAGEPTFDLARLRAAIAVNQVAIVAVLASFEVAVSAGGRAGVGRPGPVGSSADRFHGAGLRAAGAVAIEEAVRSRAASGQLRRIRAAVAGFSRFNDAIAAFALRADAGRSGTARARLDLAGRRTAIATHVVAVVALLANSTLPSPQVGVQGFPATRQLQPGSSVQVEEQPSPSFVFPSSHSLFEVNTLFPQTPRYWHGCPGFGQVQSASI